MAGARHRQHRGGRMKDFARFLENQARQFRTKKAFAEALKVDPTHLSRAMGKNSRPFDIRGLFTLARVTGVDIDTVLRAAGKDEIADAIAEFYGPPQPQKSRELKEIVNRCERI